MRKLQERWRENELPGSHSQRPPKGAGAGLRWGRSAGANSWGERLRDVRQSRGACEVPRVTASLNSPRSGQGQWSISVKTLVGRGRNFPQVLTLPSWNAGPRWEPRSAPPSGLDPRRPRDASAANHNSFLPEAVASLDWVPATSQTGSRATEALVPGEPPSRQVD